MNNNLTPRAEQTIAYADKIRQRHNHSYTGTEHLFISLLKIEGSVSKLLLSIGIDPTELRARFEQALTDSEKTETETVPSATGFDAAALLRDIANVIEKHSKP